MAHERVRCKSRDDTYNLHGAPRNCVVRLSAAQARVNGTFVKLTSFGCDKMLFVKRLRWKP